MLPMPMPLQLTVALVLLMLLELPPLRVLLDLSTPQMPLELPTSLVPLVLTAPQVPLVLSAPLARAPLRRGDVRPSSSTTLASERATGHGRALSRPLEGGRDQRWSTTSVDSLVGRHERSLRRPILKPDQHTVRSTQFCKRGFRYCHSTL